MTFLFFYNKFNVMPNICSRVVNKRPMAVFGRFDFLSGVVQNGETAIMFLYLYLYKIYKNNILIKSFIY